MIKERFDLAVERIAQVKEEIKLWKWETLPRKAASKEVEGRVLTTEGIDGIRLYFTQVAEFLTEMVNDYQWIQKGGLRESTAGELKERNQKAYADIIGERYEQSFANPDVAVRAFGIQYGRLFSFLYTELRALIACVYEGNLYGITIRLELFLEIYSMVMYTLQEEKKLPPVREIKDSLYWFVSDYSEVEKRQRIQEQVDAACDFAASIIMKENLEDLRYLYFYGEYISENEVRTAEFLNSLPLETIQRMADTFTEGYRMGFVTSKKPLDKKKTVNIRYSLGFERVMKQAIINFRKMGLEPVIFRGATSILHNKGVRRIGYVGGSPNKQYDYDHKEDIALFLDKMLVKRMLEVQTAAFEEFKDLAAVHGGPACMETFGETPFVPVSKKSACELSDKQQKLSVEYISKSGQIVNRYIKGEERSFTIIAFPTPDIGKDFSAIFEEVIQINTLDYQKYQAIQQCIIDLLDTGEYVHVVGNTAPVKTDLYIHLLDLQDAEKETKFENCVADVNIPVGEVFTSPVLEGTHGTLFVRCVFLNELEYKDLTLVFENGRIASYTCSNFCEEEKNQKYIKDNILFHHDTLPMGEFAIGTNTTAYVAAKKFDIAHKLPILIAEKMGPHFAVGDTCYSREEEVKLYNPDGKEIVAKENEVSQLRHEDMGKAYYNCHTDITIPYDELELLEVIRKNGEKVCIIQQGRFVLEGCEELNLPFENVRIS